MIQYFAKLLHLLHQISHRFIFYTSFILFTPLPSYCVQLYPSLVESPRLIQTLRMYLVVGVDVLEEDLIRVSVAVSVTLPSLKVGLRVVGLLGAGRGFFPHVEALVCCIST